MFPECHDVFDDATDSSVWTCARSVTFGSVCFATLVLGAYSVSRIAPVFLSTRWYLTNLCMLALSVLQMALLVYECFVQSSAKILVVTKYCRGVQVAIACMLYGQLACDMTHRSTIYQNILVPIVAATTLLMTVIAVQVVQSDEIDCHNVSWLVLSTTGAVLAATFAFPGRIVLHAIQSTSHQQTQRFSSVSRTVTELEQSHQQLYVLLVCNVISSSFQLAVDIYVTFGVPNAAASCNSMFFEDGAGVFEQIVRLIVSTISYLVPNWATLYVFYVLPRYQFSTTLDLPALGNGAMDHEMRDLRDECAYELLLNEQERECR